MMRLPVPSETAVRVIVFAFLGFLLVAGGWLLWQILSA